MSAEDETAKMATEKFVEEYDNEHKIQPYSGTPKKDGVASAGDASTGFACGDHVHPTDTTRVAVETFNTEISNLRDSVNGKVDALEEGVRGNIVAFGNGSNKLEDTGKTVNDFFDNVAYDENSKKILFKNGDTVLKELSAKQFIKDGMISSVVISGGNLVITFNSDAGKQPISIPLAQIFNPSNYYDKTAADDRFVQKESGKVLSTNDYTTEEKEKLAGIESGAKNNVLEYANLAAFPVTGEANRIYVAKDTNNTYRWETNAYVQIGGGGGGGTTNYDNLSNKPSINGVTLSGNKTAEDLELATAEQGAKADSAYQKPQAGIPASDMAQAVQDIISLFPSISGNPSNIRFLIDNGDGVVFGIDEADGTPAFVCFKNGQYRTMFLPFKDGTLALLSDIPSVAGLAPLASPAFTGTPTAPTPAAADNSTKVATTAFVKTAISGISVTPLSGQTFNFATTQGVMDALKATIEALGGTVTNAPTPPAQNNQTQGE